MPKQGGKNKGKVVELAKKECPLKDDSTEYGIVQKTLGGSRFSIKLHLQEKVVIGKVRGKFRYKGNKKADWVEPGKLVLVELREFQDGVVDIVYVYEQSEVRRLKKDGHILEDVRDSIEIQDEPEEDQPFDFDQL